MRQILFVIADWTCLRIRVVDEFCLRVVEESLVSCARTGPDDC